MRAIYKIAALALLSSSFFLSSCNSDKLGMVKVKAGSLSEGMIESLATENRFIPQSENAESSLTFSISVPDFYISKYEVTQELYQEVMSVIPEANPTPSYFNDTPAEKEIQQKRPVERITWYDALEFCNRLSEREGLTPVYKLTDVSRYSRDNAIKRATVVADYSRNGYRLPTVAEWIYASCGGHKSKGLINYSGSDQLNAVAWCDENADEMTHQVGLKKPNELGLYDMTGNVAEWCWDHEWNVPFEQRPYENYQGPKEGIKARVIKGGSFIYLAAGTFFAYENNKQVNGMEGLRYYNVGFRVARNAAK